MERVRCWAGGRISQSAFELDECGSEHRPDDAFRKARTSNDKCECGKWRKARGVTVKERAE